MPDTNEPPFTVRYFRDLPNQGEYIPYLCLSPSLRASGLLTELPDGELKTLMYLLTFLYAKGTISTGISPLAHCDADE